ncbi:MAG: amidase [Acidimicrobiales bacterium]
MTQDRRARGAVTALAAAVGSRRVTAVEATRAALARIERDDPAINAVVALRADAAIEDASRLDRALAAGAAPGPLAGVPLLVKDLEDLAGMRTTKGSVPLAGVAPAPADGLVPGRLRSAGAIAVGKTNLPEFAIEGYSANLLFGATRNPWNLELSPGGSSGGSAAAVAAGMAPIATATDGGGSIRIPAALCGLVGIKPTRGLVGRHPIPDWIDFSTDGPFTTTVEDLRLLLSVEKGPVAGDPEAAPAVPSDHLDPVAIVAADRTSDFGPLPDAVGAAFHAAVDALADVLHLPVRWTEPAELFAPDDPDLDWFVVAGAEHVASLGRAWVEDNLARMHPGTVAFLSDGLAVGIDDYLAARGRRFAYARRVDELLDPAAILLTPTVAGEGWLADGRLTPDGAVGPLPASAFSTALQNITGHPAVSVPAGRLANGLPFGLQVTGPRWADGMLLRVAERWERAHPWPLAAPGYEPFGVDLIPA